MASYTNSYGLPPLYAQSYGSAPSVSMPPPVPTGIRAPASDSEGEGTSDKSRPKKRNRVALSCIPCKRRKVKCDRARPCEACVRHGVASDCKWEGGAHPEALQPFALQSEFRRLERRCKIVEDYLLRSGDVELTQLLESATNTPDTAPAITPQRDRTDPAALDQETADAAYVLEELAMGPPTKPERPRVDSELAPLRVGRTTIMLLEAEELGSLFSRSEVVQRVYACLPSDDALRGLVQAAQSNHVLASGVYHSPTIEAELSEFCAARSIGGLARVDPCYLALLCSFLASGVAELDDQQHTSFGIPMTELQRLYYVWLSAARSCLDVGRAFEVPQFRALVTITVLGGQTLLPLRRSHVIDPSIWIAAAIRTAQLLGIHRLGEDEMTMPPDDPGLPHGDCALKRQMALRLWHHLVMLDLMNGYRPPRLFIVRAGEWDCALPINVNDLDLCGGALRVPGRPAAEMTDLSFFLLKLKMFSFFKSSLSSSRDAAAQVDELEGVKKIIELDRSFSTESPEFAQVVRDCPPAYRFLLVSGIGNRMLHMHRPWATKGFTDSRFAASSRLYLERAISIAHAQYPPTSISLFMLHKHLITAALAMFQSRWCIHSRGEIVAETERPIEMVVEILERKRKDRFADVRKAADQALRLIRGLRQAEADRQQRSSNETFHEMLKRVGEASRAAATAVDAALPAATAPPAAPFDFEAIDAADALPNSEVFFDWTLLLDGTAGSLFD